MSRASPWLVVALDITGLRSPGAGTWRRKSCSTKTCSRPASSRPIPPKCFRRPCPVCGRTTSCSATATGVTLAWRCLGPSCWASFGAVSFFVPADVNFYLPLAKLGLDDIKLDRKANVVTVSLPALELGEVAFKPEAAVTVNGGLLTFISSRQVQELTALNWTSARRAMVKASQDRTLIDAAQEQCGKDVVGFFNTALGTAGVHVRVVAAFDG